MTAYSGLDGTGSILDTDTFFYNGTLVNNETGTTAVAANNILSIIIDSVGSNGFGNSLFYDNLIVIPTPSTLALLTLALAATPTPRRNSSPPLHPT